LNEAIEYTESGRRREVAVFVVSILIISGCSIIYELLISSISAYLLGSSILHFSVTIGLFMFFLGVGALISKYITEDLLDRFIEIEIAIGVAGGISTLLLFWSFTATEYYYFVTFGVTALISTLVGIEIPLVTRLVKEHQSIREAIAHILAFDYLGALIASLLFPLVLLPYLGTMRTAVVTGLVNLSVAVVNIAEFHPKMRRGVVRPLALTVLSGALLIALFIYSSRITSLLEHQLYQDEILYAEQTPFQRVVVTRFKDDLRLFLNGALQFSSVDEYRYHEPLTHIPLAFSEGRESILVIGGGDGLVAREVLKYADVKRVVLVDIDRTVVDLAKTSPHFLQVNHGALNDPRVEIVTQDAYRFMEERSDVFSAIIIDLPDPNDLALGRLYSREFYTLVKRRLSPQGVVVTQAGSPYLARRAYWCIAHTLASVFPHTTPYTAYVPSFGQWGFVAASHRPLPLETFEPPIPVKYLTSDVARTLGMFDPDMSEVPTEVNRLENQVLVQYYEASWDEWNR
jgi:spermidine synthase